MQKSNFSSLDTILKRILRDYGLEKRISDTEIVQKWPEMVGKKISGVTEPVGIKDGKLFVRVSSAAWRSELVSLRPHICNKMNELAGKKIITDIVFV